MPLPFIAVALGAIEAVSVVSTIGLSTYDSATQSEGIRQAIRNTRATTNVLKKRWDDIITGQVVLTQEIRQAILDDLDTISQNSARMRLAKEEFEKSYQNIQIAGVSLVVVIFFLLLLKRAGILDYFDTLIEEAIFGPPK